MIKIGRYLLIKFLYILIDITLVSLSLYLVCAFRQETISFDATLNGIFFNELNPYRYAFLFWIIVTIFLNNGYGLYHTKREMFETVEIWKVLKSVCLASLIMIVMMFVVRLTDFPRSVLILGTVTIFALLSFWRVIKRFFVEYLVSRGYNNFNVLIIGAGKIGSSLTEEIKKMPGLGLNVVGYLDDNLAINTDVKGVKVFGKVSNFINVARQEFINKIYVTCHHDSDAFLLLLEEAKRLKIAVRVVPHGFELMSGECSKYNIGFIPILEYCDVEHCYKQVGKRLFDFIAALCLTICIIPVVCVIAIIIKLDSPGPILYLSKRYGRVEGCLRCINFAACLRRLIV